MNEAQLQVWLKANGYPKPVERDGGILEYIGRDGKPLRLRLAPNGTFEVLTADAAGAGAPAQSAPAASAVPSGGKPMALNPDEIVTQGTWEPGVEGKGDIPNSIELPSGVERSNQYYAQYTIYRDGRRVIQWYKRGTGDGKNDPVLTTTTDNVPDIKQKWEQATAKAQPDTVSAPPTQPSIVSRDPTTGALTTIPNPNYQPPATAAAPAAPPTVQDQGGRHYVWQPNPGGPNAGGQWVDVGTAPLTPAERQTADANQPSQSVSRETGGDGSTYTVITIVPKPGQPGLPGQIVLGPNGQPAPNGVPGKAPVEKRDPIQRNGKTYIQVTTQRPDGSSAVSFTDQAGQPTTLPDEVKPGTVVKGGGPNGEDVQAIADPKTGVITYQPIPGAKAPATAGQLPTSLQGWRPDPNKPGWGLFERRDQLMAAVAQGEKKPDGTPFTGQDVAAVLGTEAQLTQTQAAQTIQQQTEQRSLRNEAMTQRAQDIGVQSGRRSNVGNMFSEARAGASPFLGKIAPPPGGSITGSLLSGQYALGQAMGAYDTPPDIPLPAFAAPYGQQSQAAAAGVPAAAELTDPTSAPWERHDPLTNTPAITPPANPVFRPAPPTNVQPSATTGPTGTVPRPEGPDVGQAAPALPTFAKTMLSPEAKLRALGYSEPVIVEALRRAGIAA